MKTTRPSRGPTEAGHRRGGQGEHDTRAFYDRLAGIYDRLSSAEAHVRERALEELAPAREDTVLEIGSATGSSLTELSKGVGDGLALGLDLSYRMLHVAAERLASVSLERRPVLIQADARRLPLRDHCLDGALMTFTLELFQESEIPRVLCEIRRVLEPGARLAVAALDSTQPQGTLVKAYRFLHQRFPRFIDCRPIALTAMLAEAGLTVEQRVPLSVWSLPVVVAVASVPLPRLPSRGVG